MKETVFEAQTVVAEPSAAAVQPVNQERPEEKRDLAGLESMGEQERLAIVREEITHEQTREVSIETPGQTLSQEEDLQQPQLLSEKGFQSLEAQLAYQKLTMAAKTLDLTNRVSIEQFFEASMDVKEHFEEMDFGKKVSVLLTIAQVLLMVWFYKQTHVPKKQTRELHQEKQQKKERFNLRKEREAEAPQLDAFPWVNIGTVSMN